MDTNELLDLAIENLRDSCNKLIKIAAQKDYVNSVTQEIKETFQQLHNRFDLCFTMKNAEQDIKRSAKKPCDDPPAQSPGITL